MWMGVEAHNMYLSVVKVFDVHPEHFVMKASVVAWGECYVMAVEWTYIETLYCSNFLFKFSLVRYSI